MHGQQRNALSDVFSIKHSTTLRGSEFPTFARIALRKKFFHLEFYYGEQGLGSKMVEGVDVNLFQKGFLERGCFRGNPISICGT